MNQDRTSNLVYRRWRPEAERKEAARQDTAIWRQYPNGDPDTSLKQLTEYLNVGLVDTSCELLWCFDGEQPVGLVAYLVIDQTPLPHYSIRTYAVLPSHQGRGIGTAL